MKCCSWQYYNAFVPQACKLLCLLITSEAHFTMPCWNNHFGRAPTAFCTKKPVYGSAAGPCALPNRLWGTQETRVPGKDPPQVLGQLAKMCPELWIPAPRASHLSSAIAPALKISQSGVNSSLLLVVTHVFQVMTLFLAPFIHSCIFSFWMQGAACWGVQICSQMGLCGEQMGTRLSVPHWETVHQQVALAGIRRKRRICKCHPDSKNPLYNVQPWLLLQGYKKLRKLLRSCAEWWTRGSWPWAGSGFLRKGEDLFYKCNNCWGGLKGAEKSVFRRCLASDSLPS